MEWGLRKCKSGVPDLAMRLSADHSSDGGDCSGALTLPSLALQVLRTTARYSGRLLPCDCRCRVFRQWPSCHVLTPSARKVRQ